MAKTKAKVTKKAKPKGKIYNGIRGCLGIGVALIVVFALATGSKKNNDAAATSRPDVRPTSTDVQAVAVQVTDTVSLVTIIPTVVNRSGFVTVAAGEGTVYPTATITDTPQPSATHTDVPTQPPVTATAAVQPINSETYYATRDSKVRKCASTDCANLGIISAGTSVVVTGSTAGQEVTAGNALWYQVQYGGQVAYVYSPSLTKNVPVQIVPTANQQFVSPVIVPPALSNNAVGCPDINATCKQLTTCEQARACMAAGNTDLDADHHGNPCEDLCGPD